MLTLSSQNSPQNYPVSVRWLTNMSSAIRRWCQTLVATVLGIWSPTNLHNIVISSVLLHFFSYWLTDLQTNRSTDRATGKLTDWLAGWLINMVFFFLNNNSITFSNPISKNRCSSATLSKNQVFSFRWPRSISWINKNDSALIHNYE